MAKTKTPVKTFIVHVIHPTGILELTDEPVRFQTPEFREGTTDAQVLAWCKKNTHLFGYMGVTAATNPDKDDFSNIQKWDTTSCPVIDHPQTIIAVVEDDGEGGVREIRRIKGPTQEQTITPQPQS